LLRGRKKGGRYLYLVRDPFRGKGTKGIIREDRDRVSREARGDNGREREQSKGEQREQRVLFWDRFQFLLTRHQQRRIIYFWLAGIHAKA